MDHQAIKDAIFEFYDGELSPGERPWIEAHLQSCPECQALLAEWRQTAKVYLQPLAGHPGERFANDVMRRVNEWEPDEDRLSDSRWRAFGRWFYPALSLSMAAFMAAFYYAAQPANTVEDALFLGSSAQVVTADWKADVVGNPMLDFPERSQ
jgi:anti-sigma factor RsiW